jgi:peptidoglycan/xylan/chitin deacetylase (PgdA/CDA1 family)
MKQVYVTTSWDDGHRLDGRLSALLKNYGIKATFYISPRDHEFSAAERLTDAEIQKLSESFEIGAHTMTHPRLDKISDSVAREEIVASKRYLEKLLNKTIVSFCYPGGRYTKSHPPMVREAGFSYARSVRRFDHGFTGTPYEANTTVNTYNHYQDLWKIAKLARFNPWKIRYYFQWDNLAKAMFDRVSELRGVFHLWGHSWEIDQHDDWQKLENVLSYIAGKKQVRYITNGELLAHKPKRLLLGVPYFPPHLGGSEFYA